jgi:hypothetical protein
MCRKEHHAKYIGWKMSPDGKANPQSKILKMWTTSVPPYNSLTRKRCYFNFITLSKKGLFAEADNVQPIRQAEADSSGSVFEKADPSIERLRPGK